MINVDQGYTFRPEQLVLTPTAASGIRLLNETGYLVIVVTNQSGVARGFYEQAHVHLFHERLSEVLATMGARIDAFYHAPYHPDGCVAPFSVAHEDRKPGAGMIWRALQEWPIRMNGSFLIGDKPSDAAAAAAAGLPAHLIQSNRGDLCAAIQTMLATHARA